MSMNGICVLEPHCTKNIYMYLGIGIQTNTNITNLVIPHAKPQRIIWQFYGYKQFCQGLYDT